eukprot:2350592-Rhodomonas_salina.4
MLCLAVPLRIGYASGTNLRLCCYQSAPRVPTPADVGPRSTCLRACYVMSGTDLRCGAGCLRVCYAMSGTEKAYGAVRLRVCQCWATPSTGLKLRVLCAAQH